MSTRTTANIQFTLPSMLSLTTLLLISACGGSSNNDSATINSSSTASTDATQANSNNTPSPYSITGRVADGYINGATVCVDSNENGLCEEGEPQALSHTGGIFTLDSTEELRDKPLIAHVPATAIDEDTGQAIGKTLVLTTPAEKPEFISPITTLVHQAMKDNPNLNLVSAEKKVMVSLGLSQNSDISLFEDYVAKAKSNDSNKTEFRFLHQTARVIASMMSEQHAQVTSAAIENGIDFLSDGEANEAIQQLINSDISELLPDVSALVNNTITTLNELYVNTLNSETATSQENLLTQEINPEQLAQKLIKNRDIDNIVEQINALKQAPEASSTAMNTLLSEPLYLFTSKCRSAQDGNQEEQAPNTNLLNCTLGYSKISLSADNTIIQEHNYTFDYNDLQWVKTSSEQLNDAMWLHLSSGNWTEFSSNALRGEVQFLDSGEATINNDLGPLNVSAATKSLNANTIEGFILKQLAPVFGVTSMTEPLTFTDNALVHHLHVERSNPIYTLFNWPAEFINGEDLCDQFNSNCNVLSIVDNGEELIATSLDDVVQRSLNGIEFNNVQDAFDMEQAFSLTLKQNSGLDADQGNDEQNNQGIIKGVASWSVPVRSISNLLSTLLSQVNCSGLTDQASDNANAEASMQILLALQQNLCKDADSADDLYEKISTLITSPLASSLLSQFGLNIESSELNELSMTALSEWSTLNVEGVSMIEVSLPQEIIQRLDQSNLASLLLIEDNGFVRAGARLQTLPSDANWAYNEASFNTLLPLVESLVQKNQALSQ